MTKKKKKTTARSPRTIYKPSLRQKIVKRLLAGDSVKDISKETGIGNSLLYHWKKQAENLGEGGNREVEAALDAVPVDKPKRTNGAHTNGAELTIQAAVPAVQAAATIQEATTKFLGSTAITSSMVRELTDTIREALGAIEVP
jgi:transposase-like protein